MKYSLIAASILVLAGCSSTSNNQQSSAPVAAKPVATQNAATSVAKSTSSTASLAGQITVVNHVPYSENANVADNVRTECHQLGKQFSNSFTKFAAKHNLPINKTNDELPSQGQVLKLTIDNVYSGGNAFIGHRKSATVSAELFVDGQSIAKTSKTRNSAGGFMGGFKGSCSVLAHTVNTLGNDVAKWLKQQTNSL